jgi:hypothetical protein
MMESTYGYRKLNIPYPVSGILHLKKYYLSPKYYHYGILQRLLVAPVISAGILRMLCYGQPGFYWRGYHVW